jgi:hypothetical protein
MQKMVSVTADVATGEPQWNGGSFGIFCKFLKKHMG